MEHCGISLIDHIPLDADCHKPTEALRITEIDTETQECELKTIIELHGQDKALEYLATKQDCSLEDLSSALITACQKGFKFLIQSLLHQGANIDCRDKDGNTPLMISVNQGFIGIARFLIKKNANINSVNAHDDTALILCLHSAGSVEMVKLFLEQKYLDLDHQNQDGYTALMKAVETLDIDVIKLLLDKQKLPVKQKKNCKNETAEQIADKLGLGNVFRLLSRSRGRDLIVTAVETNDTESLHVLIDGYTMPKKNTHEIVFKELFMFHDKKKIPFEKNHEKLIEHILKVRLDMTSKTLNFDPLGISVKLGCSSVLQLLLNHGAQKCTFRSKFDRSAVAIAAESGRVDLLEILIKCKVNINESRCYQQSPLNLAIENGHLDCVKYLIQHGARLHWERDLESAIRSQNLEVIKYLCQQFTNKNSKKVISRMLVSAARMGNLGVIDALLNAGANINHCVSGKTALMESKNGEVVNFLIRRGAVVNRRRIGSKVVQSPLTYILANNNNYDIALKEEIVEALIRNGAAVDGKSCNGRTPLMIAASAKGHKKIIHMLLNYGADVNVKDKDGSSILLLAAQNDCAENVTTILQYIKNWRHLVNTPNYGGLTPLMAAVEKGNYQMMMELIEAGADVNWKDSLGRTALFSIINYKLIRIDPHKRDQVEQIITELVKAGCNINLQDKSGFTPLMWAACCGSQKCMLELFIKAGADVNFVNHQNSQDDTALGLFVKVSEYGLEILSQVECMLEHGAHASYLGLSFLHSVILNDPMHLIPKLISSGVGPAEVSLKELRLLAVNEGLLDFPVSPLCVSLLIGNTVLARYFVDNFFLTRSDVFDLRSNTAVRQLLKERKCEQSLELLDQLSSQPLSLQKLGLLAVMEAVGAAPGRENRINKLPLPQPIKDKILFKTPGVPMEIPADRAAGAGDTWIDSVSIARNLFYEDVLASLLAGEESHPWIHYGDNQYNYYLDDVEPDYLAYSDSDY